MTRKPNGGPAYPRSGVKDGYGRVVGDVKGMTLRDYFAGQALAGFLSSWPHDGDRPDALLTADRTAQAAYTMADAMIAERAKND